MKARYRINIEELGVHEWRTTEVLEPPAKFMHIPYIVGFAVCELRLKLLAVENGVAVYA